MVKKQPNHHDIIATTDGIFVVVVDGRKRSVFPADHRGMPLTMQLYALPRGWQKAPILMVVRGDEPLGILYMTLPKMPKGESKDEWSPVLEHWEDVADLALKRSNLPKARAFTYVESYLEGAEGSPEFRKRLETDKAEFIAWV